MKSKFNVTGMTCSACQASVQRAVRSLKGVREASVNLLTHSMVVDFDASSLSEKRIIQEVVETGYDASIAEKTTKETFKQQKHKLQRRMAVRLYGSLAFLLPLFYLAMGPMVGLPIPAIFDNVPLYGVTQWVLVLPILWLNQHYFKSGLKKLFKGDPNMDSLIAIGSLTAFIYGIAAVGFIIYGYFYDAELMHHYHHQMYFEVAGAILTFVTIGKYIEEHSKHQTLGALEKLLDLTPDTAIKINANKEEQVVALSAIQVGDTILVKPGMTVPLDGVIIEGHSTINQASITGEALPVDKQVGDKVIGATLNQFGSFYMTVEKVGDDTTIAQIIRLIEEASNSKAPLAKLADQIASWFVPAVIGLALVAFFVWWLWLGQTFEFSLRIAVAILVISCPCALGLATPVAVMVGTGKGAELGILIKSAEAFEKLHRIDTIVLDKTGTITEGKPYVTDIVPIGISAPELLALVASVEVTSEHPLASAILTKAKEEKIALKAMKNFKYMPGMGVEGSIDGATIAVGNQGDVPLALNAAYQALSNQAKTILKVQKNKTLIGFIAIADVIKPSSKVAIEQLKRLHEEVYLLTGDSEKTAAAVAKEVGITQYRAGVLPQQKDEVVRQLMDQGKKVLMVGDGVNDAPALTRADVGMAIGAGTDIAIESADIVLIKSDLRDVATAISLSKHVVNNIRLNLFWAFFYNVIAIPVAAGVFYGAFNLLLDPMIAALAMAFSSITVVLNALRLRIFKVK